MHDAGEVRDEPVDRLGGREHRGRVLFASTPLLDQTLDLVHDSGRDLLLGRLRQAALARSLTSVTSLSGASKPMPGTLTSL